MAKKGTKFNEYTYEYKMNVINEYLEGADGIKRLARKHGIPFQSLHNWVTKYRKGGFESLKIDGRGKGRTGRPKKRKLPDYDSMTDKEKIAYLEMEVDILKKLKEIRKDNQK